LKTIRSAGKLGCYDAGRQEARMLGSKKVHNREPVDRLGFLLSSIKLVKIR
jgi:hypothetical protein